MNMHPMPPPGPRPVSTGGAGSARPPCRRSPRSRRDSRGPAGSHRTSVRTVPPTRAPAHRGRQSLQGPIRDDGNAERALAPVGLRYENPLNGPGRPRRWPVLRPVGQRGLLGGKQHRPAVDSGRLAARVDLRDPPHAHQGLRAGAEHELLQIPDSRQVSCLRRREDALPQSPYFVLGPLPVNRQPGGGIVFRSVHHQASNLPFSSGSCSIWPSQAHLATSAPGA